MTDHIGFCDDCPQVQSFLTSAQRDEWEMEHREIHNRWAADIVAGAIGGHR